MLLPALAFLHAASAAAGPARAERRLQADSVLAVLYPRDSATRLVLTADALHFGFTGRGARQVRRAADSASAARPRRAEAGWFDGAALARGIVDGITRDMRMMFPLASVQDVRADGATLTVCFAPRAPGEALCEQNRFVIDAATPGDARRFAAAVARAGIAR